MTMKRFETAPQDETARREREIQTLINMLWPDPEYQAVVTDEAYIWDVLPLNCRSEEAVRARLAHFFGGEFPWPLNLPLWQIVDAIKQRYPDWPEDMTTPCWERTS